MDAIAEYQEEPLDCRLECRDPKYTAQREKIKAKIEKARKFQPKKKRVRQFIGPIRVVLITSSTDQYRRKVWGNSFVIMAYFAIGAVLGAVFSFCVSYRVRPFNNLHVILFTMSTQVLMPAALLSRHLYNGSEYYSKPRHKKYDFFFLKTLAFMFFAAGVFVSLISSDMRLIPDRVWTTEDFSCHAFAGLVSGLLMLLVDTPSTILCYSFNYKRMASRLSVVLCIPSFICSVVCLLLAIVKKIFLQSLPTPLILPLIILSIIYYTFLSCFDPVRNMLPFKKHKYAFYS